MKPAADFSLPDQNGILRTLKDYAGNWIVLYFYPKDDTPGCTTEACNFRDARETIAELGNAEVIGISADSVDSHKEFATKHNLNFSLLSDTEHSVIQAYGSWTLSEFSNYTQMGVDRNTFIISPDGMIAKEYLDVNPAEHAVEIIAELKKLQSDAHN